ncbi:MAG: hypothetical protein K0B02_03965 [DPANN group archaeon]|nr:hypothetical protein [DPANN group archaeon]
MRSCISRNSRYRKAQTEVITIMILTTIAIAMVSVSYIWGKPLIQKSQTKTDIEQAKNFMFTLEDAIRDVSIYGGQKVLNIDLKGTLKVDGATQIADGSYNNLNKDNWITYTIKTKTVGTSISDWVPLDGLSPIRSEQFSGTATDSVVINDTTCTGVSIDCISKTASVSGCGIYGSANGLEGTSFTSKPEYKLSYVHCASTPYFITISGPEIPVPGIIGTNKAGVVMTKAKGIGSEYEVNYKLAYRELDDLTSGNGYLIQLVKGGNTFVGEGQHKIFIKSDRDKVFDDINIVSQVGGPVTIMPVVIYIE